MRFHEDMSTGLCLSNENQLLIHLSRTYLREENLRRVVRIINSGVNWNQFLQKANRHVLIGLVNFHLYHRELEIPVEVVRWLSKQSEIRNSMSEYLLKEIRRIASSMQEVGLPTVILKGPAIGHRVYPKISIRTFSDIDLLVRKDHIEIAERQLYELGYLHMSVDHMKNQVKPMSKHEVERLVPRTLHRPPLGRFDSSSRRLPGTIDLHPSDRKIGNFDFDSVLDSSVEFQSLGEGVRVLNIGDLTLHSVYHFYRHYGLAELTDVSTSFGSFLPRNPGALRYLADIYACLRFYLSEEGSWLDLLCRAQEIDASEILLYGLYYMDTVYGNSTIPGWVIDRLKSRPIRVPLINSSVEVSCVDELLRTTIKTQSVQIGPSFWMFNPDEVWKCVTDIAGNYKDNKGPWATGSAKRIHTSGMRKCWPRDSAWERTNDLVIDPRSVPPTHFFNSHVSGGIWCKKTGLEARAKMLWDSENIYLRINVKTKTIINYVSEELREFGDGVTLYFSNIDRAYSNIRRVRCVVCQDNSVHLIPLPRFSSKTCEDIEPRELQWRCMSSQTSYQVLLSIPWICIDVSPVCERTFGFDLEVLHWSDNIETVLAWSGAYMLSEAHQSVHGVVTLID